MIVMRKLAAILVADIVGYSRLAGADEDGTLARLRALRSELIDPTIATHHGRLVKRTGAGAMVRSVWTCRQAQARATTRQPTATEVEARPEGGERK